MKKITLLLLMFVIFNVSAQTTHNLNWFTNIGSNVDLTIESGDTVIWTWTNPNHTVENNPAGTSVETFDSGFLGPTGSTFSHTFTIVGSNDYYCSIHGAPSMSGTITVSPSLSVKEISGLNEFTITPNPVKFSFEIELPSGVNDGTIEIYNILGKLIYLKQFSSLKSEHNISTWDSGIYIVKVTSEFGTASKRLIKQ